LGERGPNAAIRRQNLSATLPATIKNANNLVAKLFVYLALNNQSTWAGTDPAADAAWIGDSQ
jgi:hypothetical protein